jgi:hypothetical protein
MQTESKNSSVTKVRRKANGGHGWFETAWYYVSISYCGKQMGLLVATDSEEEAQREAQAVCMDLGDLAKLLSVMKLVIQ